MVVKYGNNQSNSLNIGNWYERHPNSLEVREPWHSDSLATGGGIKSWFKKAFKKVKKGFQKAGKAIYNKVVKPVYNKYGKQIASFALDTAPLPNSVKHIGHALIGRGPQPVRRKAVYKQTHLKQFPTNAKYRKVGGPGGVYHPQRNQNLRGILY